MNEFIFSLMCMVMNMTNTNMNSPSPNNTNNAPPGAKKKNANADAKNHAKTSASNQKLFEMKTVYKTPDGHSLTNTITRYK